MNRVELWRRSRAARRQIAAARTSGRRSGRSRPRPARRRDSAARRQAAAAALGACALAGSTSRMWSSVPEASPTRTSATYIGGNSEAMVRNGFAETLARQNAGTHFADNRPQPADVDIRRQAISSASSSRAPALRSSARSRVKTVTSSGRGRRPKARLKRESAPVRSSVTVSIGTRPRYSMRCATSAADGAEIDPVTTSPACVRAR